MRRVGLNGCPYCGGSEVYASVPKTLLDKFPVLFLLRLARCHSCTRRHNRPIFLEDSPRKMRSVKPAGVLPAEKTEQRAA
jgi:hypothetical protein